MKLKSVSIAVSALVLGVVASLATLPVQAGTLDDIRARGFARAAIHNEPPYAFMTPDGTAAGVGPEVMTAVLKRLGVEQIDWVVTPFSTLIPGLKAGRWDVVAAQQSIFPERCQQVNFGNPTSTAAEALLVKAGNPKKLHSYDDIKNDPTAKVAVPTGSVQLKYLKAYGIPDDRIVLFSNHADAPELVLSGRVDAYTIEDAAADLLLRSGRVKGLEVADPFKIPVVDGKEVISYAGATFKKEDTDFVEAFNKELGAFEKTPDFAAIMDKNGLRPISAKRALAMTAAERCAGK
ncbi:ectoine/hydroxyectoine ABC transporter substrate-binding protein EhuB [Labrys wisconsinensis]|uniref:Polar amino acid transport system substrate-binding protein n=1 Tax=Labrys wisconsinensis TaxID=425677 RepID=A0ABU0JER9_9HYPH|nr:ectoine/hydroxyectoine ABC transporter substrate-binding protein EhuB [Labrys wisconsinensis]MDQ0472110.1 polar amino acid transport system substrate-binding protein [Labrys wisconsinensis]